MHSSLPRHCALGALAITLTLAAGSGAARAQPVRIDWCGGRTASLGGKDLTQSPTWQDPHFSHQHVAWIAWQGCSKRLTDRQRAATATAYRRLAQWSKLPHAQLRAYLAAQVFPPGGADPVAAACKAHPARNQPTGGLAKLLGCSGAKDWHLVDDPREALATAGTMYQIFVADTDEVGDNSVDLARFALYGPEARALDRAAIDRELVRLGVNPIARTRVHLDLRRIQATLGRFDAILKPIVARNPGLADLYYRTPNSAYARGVELLTHNAGDVKMLGTFANLVLHRSGAKLKGCFGILRPRLMAHLSLDHVATLDQVRHALDQPLTVQLARALTVCSNIDHHWPSYLALGKMLEGAREFRGPRSVVYYAVSDAVKRMGHGSPLSPQDLVQVRVRPPDYLPAIEPGQIEGETATVKRVVRRGGTVLVKFATGIEKHIEHDCHDTSTIDRVGSDGRLKYREKCSPWRTVTQRVTPPPAAMAADVAAGLARGRPVMMFCDLTVKPRRCAPLVVWKSRHKKRVAAFLGAPL